MEGTDASKSGEWYSDCLCHCCCANRTHRCSGVPARVLSEVNWFSRRKRDYARRGHKVDAMQGMRWHTRTGTLHGQTNMPHT